ncbi:c-type cytochrome [Stutzerimonas stutzeri]|uniref:c-type cytochrome n=1 Tax=Stutzerimonas stutzeri TaxID=316 RepID=UPI00210D80B3|nr:cytochrome c [Stutzerimonas stutzeri]MCQ4260252.1 cytochrome c [Stutzerimonas stutzeri]
MRTLPVLYAGMLGLTASLAQAGDGSDSYDLVARGRYLAVLGDCTACHSLPGQPAFAGGVAIDTPFGTVLGANITPDPDTGIGRWSFEDFQNTMSNGHARGGKRLYAAMPYTAYTKVTREDNRALWAYLNSLEPVRHEVETNQLPFPFNIRASLIAWNWLAFEEGEYEPDPDQSAEWNRGAYLVQGLGHCGSCHTPKSLIGGDKGDEFLTGSALQGWMAPDITGNAHAGLGSWSEAEIVHYLKTGANRFDMASGPMAEAVEHSTQHWKDEDLSAVATYIKSLGDEQQPRPEPLAAEDATMRTGSLIYEDQCSACHTPDGEGITNLFPRLAQAPLVNSRDATSLIRVVLAGSRAVATDAAPTGPAMPSFAWNMSDEHIAAVLTYVRNSWGNAAEPVSTGDVKAMRDDMKP